MTNAVRACLGAGLLLVASGLVYAGLFTVDGGEWEGPTTLRKPILFGLSTGVTLLSVAWVLTGLPRRRIDGWLYGSLAAALVVEVVLIDLQQARGVPSHFNQATSFDASVSVAMTVLIAWASLVLAEITARAWRRTTFAADEATAARLGMALLLLGCVLGGVITAVGEANVDAGRRPEIYGEAGVLKFPHGLPLHAIQLLHLQALALRWFGATRRARSIRAAALGILGVTIYGVAQTFLGAPRFPPTALGWMAAIVAVAAFVRAIQLSTSDERPAAPRS